MKVKSKKYFQLTMIIVLILIIGSFREVLFVNVNNQIAFLQGGLKENYLLNYLKFLEGYSENDLVVLKWILTVVYCLIFYLLGYYVLRNLFRSIEGSKWYGRMYLIFIGIAGISFLIGGYSASIQNFYSFSRSIMGALQSPIPLLLFLPLLLAKKKPGNT